MELGDPETGVGLGQAREVPHRRRRRSLRQSSLAERVTAHKTHVGASNKSAFVVLRYLRKYRSSSACEEP